MSNTDFYQILGVEEKADNKKIKEAYRQLAFLYHPDRNNKDPDSADKMKAINEAYAVLSNPEKRKEYDHMRLQYGASAYGKFKDSYSDSDIFNGSDINQIFEEVARSFGLRGFDDIFNDFYGGNYKKFEFSGPGLQGKGFIFKGGFGPFGNKKQKHSMLGGLGRLSGLLLGRLGAASLPAKGKDTLDVISLTPEFAETGGPYPYYHKSKNKKLVVKIPAGIAAGKKIRLAGLGEKGKNGGPNGDHYLKIKSRKRIGGKIKDFVVSVLGK